MICALNCLASWARGNAIALKCKQSRTSFPQSTLSRNLSENMSIVKVDSDHSLSKNVVMLALRTLWLEDCIVADRSSIRVDLSSKAVAYRSFPMPVAPSAEIPYDSYGVFPTEADDTLQVKVSIVLCDDDGGREKTIAVNCMLVALNHLMKHRFLSMCVTFPQGDVEVLSKWRATKVEGYGPAPQTERDILRGSAPGPFKMIPWQDVSRLYTPTLHSASDNLQALLECYESPNVLRNRKSDAPRLDTSSLVEGSKEVINGLESMEWYSDDALRHGSPMCSTVSSLSLSDQGEDEWAGLREARRTSARFLCGDFVEAASKVTQAKTCVHSEDGGAASGARKAWYAEFGSHSTQPDLNEWLLQSFDASDSMESCW